MGHGLLNVIFDFYIFLKKLNCKSIPWFAKIAEMYPGRALNAQPTPGRGFFCKTRDPPGAVGAGRALLARPRHLLRADCATGGRLLKQRVTVSPLYKLPSPSKGSFAAKKI